MKINKIVLIVTFIVIFILGYITGSIDRNSQDDKGPIDLNPLSNSCEYNGKTYASGDGFLDADGCNTCSCEDGNVACTLMACEKN